MKLIHFSDTHLGFNDLDIINESGINQREADFYDAFIQLIEQIQNIKSNYYIVHANDTSHSSYTFTKVVLLINNTQGFSNLILAPLSHLQNTE